MVKLIKSEAELQDALTSAGQKLLVVDFTASWCGPCRAIAPLFEKLAEAHQDVVFLKLDIDNTPEIAKRFGIRSVPTFLFFKNKEKISQMSGADVNGLKAMILQHK